MIVFTFDVRFSIFLLLRKCLFSNWNILHYMQENAKYYILKVQHFVVVITKVIVKTEGHLTRILKNLKHALASGQH